MTVAEVPTGAYPVIRAAVLGPTRCEARSTACAVTAVGVRGGGGRVITRGAGDGNAGRGACGVRGGGTGGGNGGGAACGGVAAVSSVAESSVGTEVTTAVVLGSGVGDGIGISAGSGITSVCGVTVSGGIRLGVADLDSTAGPSSEAPGGAPVPHVSMGARSPVRNPAHPASAAPRRTAASARCRTVRDLRPSDGAAWRGDGGYGIAKDRTIAHHAGAQHFRQHPGPTHLGVVAPTGPLMCCWRRFRTRR